MNPWIAAALALTLIAPPKPAKHEQWDAEIAKLEAKAAKRRDLYGGVVFTGSSSIKNWKTLSKDFNGIPVINGKILKAMIPNSRLQTFAGGGHLFLLSHREQSVSCIRAFLEREDQAQERRRAA